MREEQNSKGERKMWIELEPGCIEQLCAQGWKLTHGQKSYLTSPNGLQLPLTKSAVEPTNLYVIQAKRSTRFKVGIAGDPLKRVRDLQIGSPLDLELICSVKIETPKIEFRAHDLLSCWRSHGEWFDLGEHAKSFRSAVTRSQSAADVLSVFERRMRTFQHFGNQNALQNGLSGPTTKGEIG
jgi:hypothetical protein